MNGDITWGILIALYLFTAGISAGAAILASVFDIFQIGDSRVSKAGAYLAPFPVMLGLLCLVLDLSRPLKFYLVLLNYNLTSVMSWGVLFLLVFPPVAVIYAFLWYTEISPQIRKVFAWLSLILGIAVGGYTGLLLGAVSFSPVWSNPVITVLFLVSAISTGVCGSMLVAKWLLGLDNSELEQLTATDSVLIVVELLTLIILIITWALGPHAGQAMKAVVTGGYFLWFWLGVVMLGLLAPLFLGFWGLGYLGKTQSRIPMVGPILVLIGGFILRFVIVYGGQISTFIS